MSCCCCNEWFEIFSTHSDIAPLSMHSQDKSTQPGWNVGNFFLSYCLPLKINNGGNFVSSAHNVIARVAHLVSCVEVNMMTVFIFFISKVCFGVRGEDSGLIYIDNIFFTIFLIYFFHNLLHEIKWIWCCLCRWALRFMMTHLYLNPSAFNHLYTINDFAPSDLAWKIQHKSNAFLGTICVTTIPCS